VIYAGEELLPRLLFFDLCMPELPEVETIIRSLQKGGRGQIPIPGKVIHSAVLTWPRTLAEPEKATFLKKLPGQRVEEVNRRGKFVVIHLDIDTLLIHLRMSGDLRVEPESEGKTQPHDRLVIHFTDGSGLFFNDTRKFGRVWLVTDPQLVLGELGSEPLGGELTPTIFHSRITGRKRQLKPLLLDQSFLAGLGNIYTDEALHLACLHPLRSSDSLSGEESGKLLQSIRKVLREGIRRNGASIDWVYRGGDFQNHFRVYQRTGQPCPVCGTPIKRILVGQRSSHFCPVCQPPGI
jgi:formamidopyrimidine-DNA glycosylase